MKTKRNLIQIYLLGAALLLPAVTQAQFTFTTNNGAITITSYTGTNPVLIIPGATNGYPVTSIGSYAFAYNYVIVSATIPNTVTNIGDFAFRDCVYMTDVTIGTNVVSIGNSAFKWSGLTNVTIPASVTTIGDTAFGGTSLIGISVNTNNPVFASVAGVLFSKDLNALVQYPPANPASSYEIPATVTSIADFAFGSSYLLQAITVDSNNFAYVSVGGVLFNKSMTELVQYPMGSTATSYAIPDGVSSLSQYAFWACYNLANIEFPSSITSIGFDAFENSSFTNVTFSAGLTNIASWAFYDCTSLTSVYFKGDAPSADCTVFQGDPVTVYYQLGTTGWSNTFACVSVVGWSTNSISFMADPINGPPPLLVQFTSPDVDNHGSTITNWNWNFGDGSAANVRSPSHAYNNSGTFNPSFIATNSQGVAVIGSGPQIVVSWPFTFTTNNGTITITRYIGTNTALIIPSTINGLPVIAVGDRAFVNSSITSVTIPNSVTSIGSGAFEWSGLSDVTIPNSVTNIGNYAFYGCSLQNATIESGAIGDYAFYDCIGLTNVTLGTNVVSIGDYAFADGYFTYIEGYGGGYYFYVPGWLNSVTIPNSVTNIGNHAFYGCALQNAIIESGAIGDYAFYDCIYLTNVTIGTNVTSIGAYAFTGDYYYYLYGQIVNLNSLLKNDFSLKHFSGSNV
jgi:hypothetical protein